MPVARNRDLESSLTLTFAAVIETGTVKMILGLACKWGTSAKHGDIPNAYVKALEEEHDIFYISHKAWILQALFKEASKF